MAARNALKGIAPEVSSSCHSLLKEPHGASRRSDVAANEGISYESFNPPVLWGSPYSVQRVRFDPRPKTRYISHRGEELLLPVQGKIKYHFYWSPGGAPPARSILGPIGPQTLVRIHSQVPHHTWAHGKRSALAWMIFRDARNSTAAVSTDADESSPDENDEEHGQAGPRGFSSADLDDPARYALIAWGLAQEIRQKRERAKYKLGRLAKKCKVDQAQLSRLEAGDANVSLATLLKVAGFLGLAIDQIVDPAPWSHSVADLSQTSRVPKAVDVSPFSRPPGALHMLHPRHRIIPSGTVQQWSAGSPVGAFSSWIVLRGRAIATFSVSDDAGGGDSDSALLQEGRVLHLRNVARVEIRAEEETEILQVTYSAQCDCQDDR